MPGMYYGHNILKQCLLHISIIFPSYLVNMDMLFFTYAIFFYFYGVYLHSGHEIEWLSAHNSYFNTSFQVT